MAIVHFKATAIRAGSSPVAAAAYRHRTSMYDVAESRSWSYRPDRDLVHSELALPDDAPTWIVELADHTSAVASAALWNAVVAFETRADAQFARELTIALPEELTREENIALARDYVNTHFTSRGLVVDWVFHDKPGNPHIHLMHTLRPLAEAGFGPKRIKLLDEKGGELRSDNGDLWCRHFAASFGDIKDLRVAWCDVANAHLARAGHDIRLDPRTFADRGIALTPTIHLGSAVSALLQDGRPCHAKAGLDYATATRIREINAKPSVILDIIVSQ